MSEGIMIALGFFIITGLAISGMPIFAALGLGAILGALPFVGIEELLQGGLFAWKQLNTVGLLAMPGFVLMGNLFFQQGFGNDLFESAYKWLGRLPGGLLLATTALGAMFGFVSGSMMAGLATVGAMALPEIEAKGYDTKLSMGALAIAGTLASLIPPSLLMILYASLAEIPLGPFLIAGILPGLLLSALIMVYISIRFVINPNLGPAGLSTTLREKLQSLKGLFPVAGTFIFIFGGLYLGFWSAVEASASGAVLALLFCLVYRRLTWNGLERAFYQTVRLCGMVYLIIISAGFLNYFIFVSHTDERLLAALSLLPMPSWMLMLFIMILLSLMGCFMDALAIVLVSVPVFMPAAVALGYEKFWFGIILIVACELAQVTPPVGVNLYIIRDMAAEGTTTADIIKGAIPFVGVVWALFVLLLLFPDIALWLPSLM
jgi:tripartite ATP-independent transporter DctM subunit